MTSEKRCTKCGLMKPLEQFPRKQSRKDGRGSACLECHRGYTQNHYQANRQYYIEKAARQNQEWQRKVSEVVDPLKAKPCADCGQCFPPCAMDFDHVDGDKEFNISEASRMWDARFQDLLAELAKCEVVCSNCHRIRTHLRTQGSVA